MRAGDSGGLELARDLPVAFTHRFSADDVPVVRRAASGWIRDAGVTGDAAADFLIAVHELVINAAGHGGGRGVLTLRLGRGMLVAEVSDHGPGFVAGVPPTGTFPAADTEGGRGLVLARTLSDAMSITGTRHGVTAVVMLRVTSP
ncbi:MAG TPA: ATP-binding protein [Actinoplanes sp.]|nr:ATP-binding protein [Actinoplanes sp.]